MVNKIFITVVCICVTLVFFFGVLSVQVVNEEVNLKNRIRAKSQANQASLDTMWKIIRQKANVTDKFSQDRLDLYHELVSGRSGGTLFKSLQEANPEMDASLYKDLMNSIESERKSFKTDQQLLVDLVRERNDLVNMIPSKWILGMFGDTTEFRPKGYGEWNPDYQYTFILSSDTKAMSDSGEENTTELFKAEK